MFREADHLRVREVFAGLPSLDSQKRDQLLRIADRQPTQQQCVNETEDGGVRPDAERERQDGDDRESRRPAERPHRVVQIAARVGEPHERPRIAMELLRLLCPTERETRCAARRLRRHSAAFVLFLQQPEVERQLSIELSVRPPGADHIRQPRHEPPEHAGGYDRTASTWMSSKAASTDQPPITRSSDRKSLSSGARRGRSRSSRRRSDRSASIEFCRRSRVRGCRSR